MSMEELASVIAEVKENVTRSEALLVEFRTLAPHCKDSQTARMRVSVIADDIIANTPGLLVAAVAYMRTLESALQHGGKCSLPFK